MNARFLLEETPLSGVCLMQRIIIDDSRGSFSRLFCHEVFQQFGFSKSIAQINTSYTARRGTVRGLHFQHAPHQETKLVTCLIGEIYDVVVDVRQDSPTFLNWYGVILSRENGKSLLIPEGFAHGFQAMTDNVDIVYIVSAPFAPESEGGLHYADPRLEIRWPLAVTDISEKDYQRPFLSQNFKGI